MDSYDAILEQLKRAQSRGLEAVNNRLDFVIESLNELVLEAKSSVQEAQPREAEELFPIVDVAKALTELREQAAAADARAEELARQVGKRRAEAPVGAPMEWLRRLDAARSQSEVLRELLPLLAENAGRAVVLVMRGGTISAWSGIGFADGERLRAWQAEVEASEVIRRLVEECRPVRFEPAVDATFSEWLGDEERPSEALLVPVVLHGKVMGAVYVDSVDGGHWDPDLAQGLVATTCWLIDTLPYRQSVPTPTVAECLDLREEGSPAAEVEAVGEVPFEEEAEVRAPEPTEVEVEVEEAAGGGLVAVEIEDEAPADIDPSATVQVDLSQAVVPPTVEEPAEAEMEAAPEIAPAVEFEPALVPPPSVEVEPPPVEPVTPPVDDAGLEAAEAAPALTAEDEARHEEARRFARLLVSEIKLYNEEEVERGRANKDLARRLKEDIDRSREMYEKRIPPEVRTVRDYFHEELLRVLADGDADALGM